MDFHRNERVLGSTRQIVNYRYPSHKYHLFCSTGSIDDGCRSKENRAIQCRLLWFITADGG